ncbi:MAG: aminotransferase class III-fold pyridoxal phosphate-dependent enzyme [PVC group bacterium]
MNFDYTGPKIIVDPPGPKAKAWIERDNRVLSTSLSRTNDLVALRAHGPYVEDVDGNVFMDFGSGIAVSVMGHTEPTVVKAVQDQAAQLIHANSCDYLTLPQVEYAERFVKLCPGDFKKRVFFSNSGAECIECGIKVARYNTGRAGSIAFLGAFHGRFMGSLALTTNSPVSRRRYISSMMPGVAFSPYAYCYRCPFKQKHPGCGLECLQYLKENVLNRVIPPEDCAFIIVEPIQGAGGFIIPPKEFLQGVQEVCRENGILLMVDEVQTAFGKTGYFLASEYFGLVPDILCVSKAIAAGLPMGITVTRSELMEWELNTHENTLGGNPVVVAGALAVLDLYEKKGFTGKAAKVGEWLQEGIRELQEKYELIGDVRALGTMVGIELVESRKTKEPATKKRNRLIELTFKKGLLILGAGKCSVRLAPVHTMTEDEVKVGIQILDDALAEITG